MTAAKKGGSKATTVSKTAGSAPAKIPPATEFNPSGAPQQVVPDVDPSHPAVDNDPRADTTLDQNRIDFNDPKKSGAEVVTEQLGQKPASESRKA